jgi:hypothetical protein
VAAVVVVVAERVTALAQPEVVHDIECSKKDERRNAFAVRAHHTSMIRSAMRAPLDARENEHWR